MRADPEDIDAIALRIRPLPHIPLSTPSIPSSSTGKQQPFMTISPPALRPLPRCATLPLWHDSRKWSYPARPTTQKNRVFPALLWDRCPHRSFLFLSPTAKPAGSWFAVPKYYLWYSRVKSRKRKQCYAICNPCRQKTRFHSHGDNFPIHCAARVFRYQLRGEQSREFIRRRKTGGSRGWCAGG